MSVAILGKKIGMTQIFDETGKAVPVTVIKVEPTYVVQKRAQDVDGYSAVQLGAVKAKKATKARTAHCKKAGVDAVKTLKEIRDEKVDALELGDKVSLEMFSAGDFVNVTSRSIGKGFQGVMKRHGFAGGPASHGSDFHRQCGGIGSRAGGKGAVKKIRRGKPMPGQMGNKRITVQNLKVVDVDIENELLVLKGNVPGGGNNLVTIINSYKKSPDLEWKVIKPEVVEELVEEKQAEVPVQEDAAPVKADETAAEEKGSENTAEPKQEEDNKE